MSNILYVYVEFLLSNCGHSAPVTPCISLIARVCETGNLFQLIYTENSNRFFLFFSYFLRVSIDTLFDIFIPFKYYCTQSVPKSNFPRFSIVFCNSYSINPSSQILSNYKTNKEFSVHVAFIIKFNTKGIILKRSLSRIFFRLKIRTVLVSDQFYRLINQFIIDNGKRIC